MIGMDKLQVEAEPLGAIACCQHDLASSDLAPVGRSDELGAPANQSFVDSESRSVVDDV